MNNKRGISPLIATVLIIGFTVALGAVIMMWGSGFVTNLQESSEASQAKSLSCTAVGLELTNVEQIASNRLKLLVENTGQENIKSIIIRITGDRGTASVTKLGINVAAKKAYTMRFTPTDVGIITNIEVIPTLEINQKAEPCTPGITLAAEAPQEEEVEEWTEETSMCGNGAIDTDSEYCDGTALDDQDCTTLRIGYTGGTLACYTDCTLDTSACTGTNTCGNLALDTGEECDIDEDYYLLFAKDPITGEATTCKTIGYTGGTLDCDTSICEIDTTGCTEAPIEQNVCGNGIKEEYEQLNEECDVTDFGEKTCENLGIGASGGTLSCSDGCMIETNQCTICGDGTKQGTEACDAPDFGGQTCQTRGWDGGTLGCTNCATIDTSLCETCGNNIKEGTEQCDGTDLGEAVCGSGGLTGRSGTLSCKTDCTLDTSACTVPGAPPGGTGR